MSAFTISKEWGERVLHLLDPSVEPSSSTHEMEAIEDRFELVRHRLRRRLFEIRCELIFTLLPKKCLVRSDATGRKALARDHLIETHGLSSSMATSLGNRLLALADRLAITRKDVARFRHTLFDLQRGLCGHCRQNLTDPPETLPEDVFKPYRWFPDELDPEVDHIDPVSLFGSNEISNLVLLCRFCNGGKSNSMGLALQDLQQFSAAPLKCPPSREMLPFLRRLVFHRIELDSCRCSVCAADNSASLTVRVVNPAVPLVPQNLRTLCVPCADNADARSMPQYS